MACLGEVFCVCAACLVACKPAAKVCLSAKDYWDNKNRDKRNIGSIEMNNVTYRRESN